MRKFAILFAALVFSGPAFAADMAVKMPLKYPPPPAPADSWTGFYVGGQLGYGWTGKPNESVVDTAGVYLPVSIGGRGSGAVGGLHVGYNWQVAPTFVLGVEGDWSSANLKAGGTQQGLPIIGGGLDAAGFATMNTDVRQLGSVRGRVGYATTSWLTYLTGGGAWADMKFSGDIQCLFDNCANIPAHAPVSGLSATRTGWVLGGGLEYKALASPWIFGLEYLNYQFSGSNGATAPWIVNATGIPTSFGNCQFPGMSACERYNFGSMNVQTITARVSYKFN